MRVVITEWALQSYLDLKQAGAFTPQEYWGTIRPDVELLARKYPNDPKFSNHRFWGLATDKNNNPIPGGFKMKWHNIGNGGVQLRLTVALVANEFFLCAAYTKSSKAHDQRQCAVLKRRINLITQNQFSERGEIK